MKNATRELLLITNAARAWGEEHFYEQVNDLMSLVDKVDTTSHLARTTEVLNVYDHSLSATNAEGSLPSVQSTERPFAFTAFRN